MDATELSTVQRMLLGQLLQGRTRYRGALMTPVDIYGCKTWTDCDSLQVAPPYDPGWPKRCRRHRVYMRTPIEKGARTPI